MFCEYIFHIVFWSHGALQILHWDLGLRLRLPLSSHLAELNNNTVSKGRGTNSPIFLGKHWPAGPPLLSLISALNSHPRLHSSPSVFSFSTRHTTFPDWQITENSLQCLWIAHEWEDLNMTEMVKLYKEINIFCSFDFYSTHYESEYLLEQHV